LREQQEQLPAADNGFKRWDAQELAEQFYEYADGNPELIEVIDAAAIIIVEQAAELKPDDIAKMLLCFDFVLL
jgi:hypothetical protein